MSLTSRLKQAIQIVVGGHSVGRTVVKGATINGGAFRPKQGEEWLHAFNTMPWLRANVAKIAGGVASLEWGISRTLDANGMTVKRPDIQRGGYDYRRKVLAAMEDEEKADTTFDHPFLALLKNPCPALPGKAALILAQVYYEIVGEVFFVVDRGSRDEWLLKSNAGRPLPTALWPIPPTWVKRVPTPDNPTFEIRQSGLQMDKIPFTEVLWLKNPDPVNPYARGVGIFNSLSDELDSDENAAKMIAYSFYNRNRPDLLVSLPGADEVEMRAFKQDWLSSLSGVTNALKSHFVNIEAKVEQLGYDFREMQVIDLRRHTRDTIRQVPGVPPEILGIQDQSNRATIDAAEYIFGKHVIVPRAEVWRDFWQTQLVVEYDDRAVLDYVSPVQEDKNFTLNVVTGRPEVVKVNEVRKLGGLPALTDEEGGNLFFVNGAFVPSLATAPAANAMPGAPQGPGGGLDQPGFEGGINVPGAPTMHLSVPGAAGSAESGRPAQIANPALAAGAPAGGGGMRPTTLPAPDGNGPGYSLAGRLKGSRAAVQKIHHPHVVDDGDGFKVVDDDGKVYGTHDNEADAEDQVRALYAAKKRDRKGVAAVAAGRFRGLASHEVTPDEALLIATWAKACGYQFDAEAVAKTAPIPITNDRATEWLRRALAFYNEQSTTPWDSMLGPWSDADTKMFDAMLTKGDYEGHPFRGNQWTEGAGAAAEDGGDTHEPRAESDPPPNEILRLRDKASEIASQRTAFDYAPATEEARNIYTTVNAALQAMGVKVTGSAVGLDDIGRPADHSALVVKAAAMLRVQASLLALPAATREQILKEGLSIDIKPYDPNADKFEANGQTFVRGGSASGYGEAMRITLVSMPSYVRGSVKEGDGYVEKEFKLAGEIGLGVIAHELGHVSMDTSGNLDNLRFTEFGGKARSASNQWNDLAGARLEMKDIAGTYRRGADEIQKALDEGRVPPDRVDGVRELIAHYRREGEQIAESVKALRPIEEKLGKMSTTASAFISEHAEAMRDLTKAVNEEGGITEYAETWNQDPRYGKSGAVKDPVHRGVHETIAEIESFYAKVVSSHREPPSISDFAKALANGDAKTIYGLRDVRANQKNGGGKYPAIAKAWKAWRKVMEKGAKVTRTLPRLSKLEKEALRAHGLNRTYSDWQRGHERIQSDIDGYLSEFAGTTEGTYPRP